MDERLIEEEIEMDPLAEYEHLFHTLFDRSDEAIFVSEPDVNGRIIEVNQAAADMHGYTIQELAKLRTSDLHAIKDFEHARQGIERMLQGQWIEKEHEHFRKDRSTFPVRYRAGVTQYLGRRVIISFVRDITEEKRMEHELRQCESKLAPRI